MADAARANANAGPAGTLDEAQVRHVAKLARLKLDDAAVALYAKQLGGILEYVDQLKSVDVTGVEPMAHPLSLQNVLREDVVKAGLTTQQVLANAPGKDGPYFAVPKVLDTGMSGG
jgi:aspartyl-tRNA(Asn)/glutamyl-tRNA(Gln) amidotransferase subunit C